MTMTVMTKQEIEGLDGYAKVLYDSGVKISVPEPSSIIRDAWMYVMFPGLSPVVVDIYGCWALTDLETIKSGHFES